MPPAADVARGSHASAAILNSNSSVLRSFGTLPGVARPVFDRVEIAAAMSAGAGCGGGASGCCGLTFDRCGRTSGCCGGAPGCCAFAVERIAGPEAWGNRVSTALANNISSVLVSFGRPVDGPSGGDDGTAAAISGIAGAASGWGTPSGVGAGARTTPVSANGGKVSGETSAGGAGDTGAAWDVGANCSASNCSTGDDPRGAKLGVAWGNDVCSGVALGVAVTGEGFGVLVGGGGLLDAARGSATLANTGGADVGCGVVAG